LMYASTSDTPSVRGMQVNPSPANPGLHTHMRPTGRSVQIASVLHPPFVAKHSSTSPPSVGTSPFVSMAVSSAVHASASVFVRAHPETRAIKDAVKQTEPTGANRRPRIMVAASAQALPTVK